MGCQVQVLLNCYYNSTIDISGAFIPWPKTQLSQQNIDAYLLGVGIFSVCTTSSPRLTLSALISIKHLTEVASEENHIPYTFVDGAYGCVHSWIIISPSSHRLKRHKKMGVVQGPLFPCKPVCKTILTWSFQEIKDTFCNTCPSTAK